MTFPSLKKKNMNHGGAFIKIEIRFNVLATVQLFPFVTSGVLIPLSRIYEDVDVIASTQQPGGHCLEKFPHATSSGERQKEPSLKSNNQKVILTLRRAFSPVE